MNFDEYQQWTIKTVQHNNRPTLMAGELMYLGLGLAGEMGEVANQVKKIHRDDDGQLTQDRIRKICEEAGDGLWYLARILSEVGLTFEDVMVVNVAKLEERLAAGTIKGDRREEPSIAEEIGKLMTKDLPRCRTTGCDRAEWFLGDGHCCATCKYSGEHNFRCDRRAREVSLPQPVAATPTAQPSTETSVGALTGGGGEGEPSLGARPNWWFIALTPENGALKGRVIVRRFSGATADHARASARRRYGPGSAVHACGHDLEVVHGSAESVREALAGEETS